MLQVQLLKIDVEGDELDVLMGLASQDWPKIQQVVARQESSSETCIESESH